MLVLGFGGVRLAYRGVFENSTVGAENELGIPFFTQMLMSNVLFVPKMTPFDSK